MSSTALTARTTGIRWSASLLLVLQIPHRLLFPELVALTSLRAPQARLLSLKREFPKEVLVRGQANPPQPLPRPL